jgi:hypothetical protein
MSDFDRWRPPLGPAAKQSGWRSQVRGMDGLWATFSEWAAFQRGKQAEKQGENRDFREGDHSKKTFELAHTSPFWPIFWSASDRRGHGQARIGD